MSIFQIKEVWGAKVGDHEEFEGNSICLGNIDNAHPSENKIIVGKPSLGIFFRQFRRLPASLSAQGHSRLLGK